RDNIMDNLKNAGANLLNSIADDAEIVKDVYNDGLKPAVIETGKALAEPIKGATRVGRFVNAMFSSMDRWILEREYAVKETQKLLEKKLENISDDNIEPPKNYIAIPALQALSYSIDSEELRNMYANLLAKSMYNETSDKVHPAYVEIIRQLDPIDIRILEYIFSNGQGIAIKKIGIERISRNSIQYFVEVASQIEFAKPSVVSNSLDNLSRLGLIKIDNALVEKKHYEEIDNNPLSKKLYKSAELYIKDPSNEKLHFENNSMSMTALGRMFYSICNEDIE
ncbi:MAG: DUF4393 domain-containing protein, partial [Oscillospiraceae bacterium]|nr:DUF4393 domain-containing protein [Oscillospiraceae bacterium]